MPDVTTSYSTREKVEPFPAASRTVKSKRLASWVRTAQRYLLPRFVVSAVFYLRDGVLISTSSRVQLSSMVKFGRRSVVKPFSIVQTSGGPVTFGQNCAISSFNHVAAGTTAGVTAGDNVRTGPHVAIIATTREYRRKDALIVEQGYRDQGIRIGNDVLIGAGAVLVDGCEIGNGAVIGANSVVSGKVPPYAVVFGSPAKVIFWRR